jgi:hypothetical protein
MRKACAAQLRAGQASGEEELERAMRTTCQLRRSLLAFVASAALVAIASALAPARASAELPTYVHWGLESRVAPSKLVPGREGAIYLTATNLGDREAAPGGAPITITDVLPPGVEVVESAHAGEGSVESTFQNTPEEGGRGEKQAACQVEAPSTVECAFSGRERPYEQMLVVIHVNVSALPSTLENRVTLHDAGATPALNTLERPLSVSSEETYFGVESYEFKAEDEEFNSDTVAGTHPFQLTSSIDLDQGYARTFGLESGKLEPAAPALAQNLSFRLPAGLIGDVRATRECPDLQFGSEEESGTDLCPNSTAIGTALVTFDNPTGTGVQYNVYRVPVFNLIPAPGEPARFGFSVDHVPVVLDTSVRTGEDYGVTVTARDISEAVQFLDSKVTIWGEPYDTRHNAVRGWACLGWGSREFKEQLPCELGFVGPQPEASLPYLTLPTECEQLTAPVSGVAWKQSISSGPSSFSNVTNEELASPEANPEPASLSGCGSLPFAPSFEAGPVPREARAPIEASTPSGLTVKVNAAPAGLVELPYESKAEAAISETTLELPPGVQANPASADGLGTCSDTQAGFNAPDTDTEGALANDLSEQSFTPAAASCPESAKIGTVKVETPVLKEPLTGSVYLAEQDTNPFASPLVIYLIAEEPVSKVLIKLAGEVQITPSGQLISDFRDLPQAPFEHLTLHLTNGPQASQATPAFCGRYRSAATFTNGSTNAISTPSPSEFEVSSGPDGTPCPGATLPFAPTQVAESTSAQAGAFSPFKLTIERPDGDAALKTITTQLPPGAAALIASVTPCPEPFAAQGSCEAYDPNSYIGESTAYSGLGPDPYPLHGKVFLTGPYDGAPFGLSSVTRAEDVGPFSLGTIVVRSSIAVNRFTAAATIDTDAAQFFPKAGKPSASDASRSFPGLPEMLEGVPAQLKRLEVTINREGFEFNPTNCEPMAVTGQLTGYEGAGPVNVSTPFRVGNCGALPFAPKLTAAVAGQGSKEDGTTFAVTVESPGLGQANIHKVDLTIPALLPSRLTTIQKACLAATFEANPASCDEGSMIGEGTVYTPVFKNPLKGPAYLVSHGGAAFPDVEFVLQGEGVEIILDGRTDIKDGVTYSKFETAPDAPFTKFVSDFPAGPHSVLTPNVPASDDYNLCRETLTVPAEITGQNGAFIKQVTPVEITGCGGVKGARVYAARIRKHSTKGSTLTLLVTVPTHGRVIASGSGLHPLTRSFAKAGTYTLKLHLNTKGRQAVSHHRRLKVRVHLSFHPVSATGSTTAVTVTFP